VRDTRICLVRGAGDTLGAFIVRGRVAGISQSRPVRDAAVHRFDEAGKAGHRSGGQASGAAQIGGLQQRLGH